VDGWYVLVSLFDQHRWWVGPGPKHPIYEAGLRGFAVRADTRLEGIRLLEAEIESRGTASGTALAYR
jgi:hypothetical protein